MQYQHYNTVVRTNRRSLIALGGTVVATTLAGCNGGSTPESNITDGNSTDGSGGSEEPADPSVEFVSPEDGGTVEANSTNVVEVEVENFNLVNDSVAPDSVDERSGYVVTYLSVPNQGPPEEQVIPVGETVETDSVVSPMYDDDPTVGNRLIGDYDEYYIFAHLVRADDTATEFYDYVRVTTTE